MPGFGLDYYKEQYEKLLNHNQSLQVKVDELSKLIDHEAEKTITNLYSDISVIRQLLHEAEKTITNLYSDISVIRQLLGLIERQMEMDNPERGRVISLLVSDCYSVIDEDKEG